MTKEIWKISAMHLILHGWPVATIAKVVRNTEQNINALESDQEFMAMFNEKYRKQDYEQNHS